jgi:alcohol-forming fatty acyl-CoA reductase
MAERAIKERSGSLKVVIIRPSIIISAYREPLQGWIASLDAGGVVVFAGTNGLLKIT